MPKPLWVLADPTEQLIKSPETGMGFQIIQTGSDQSSEIDFVLSGKYIVPFDDQHYLSVTDVLSSEMYDANDKEKYVSFFEYDTPDGFSLTVPTGGRTFGSRIEYISAMLKLTISSGYAGKMGAFPLLARHRLQVGTTFHRFIHASSDFRFKPDAFLATNSGELTAGTYMTTHLEKLYLDSGFAVVARAALPIPLPAIYVFDYEIPAGTLIDVGTIAPLFGQSGGGVEVRLVNNVKNVKVTGSYQIPSF
ncbi:hypothetical protein [Dyadobacter sp. 3J3]|uniref:hypothetical protein n=1 Tax=Dyadobacter sp. 3J3 TaxID=2606600 RepID=UPI00135674FA|nr:hypothetical protein [Dyadobacter sp. 3J3]